MFSTDGCMPGPQFDNPVEGYGLCLKNWLAVQSRAVGSECVLVCVFVCVCMC